VIEVLVKDVEVSDLLKSYPLHLNGNNEKHALAFRRLLEGSLRHGYWNGKVALTS
jgi:hypothetical protein